ncbi:TIGR04282 family arsenosugar biosynthesis glycosyltransferase [Aurantibacter aestuarii]|uniref:Glycosyltransferase n=1 Tax=Aurantibacter aestuarii TaxID=1266046 RepID=A0A2T1NE25_9FLAO|nr:TIGR04282 family arsenosugar biosynthesis glycosyltransferase [Aurantibacter aestuarii]PSG90698.1 glycosyltransferase [Aurantibacter aestuarii]
MSSKNALIIFTRNPELGKCKTRLAKTIGDEAALRVYKFLLQHTANVAKKVEASRYAYYSVNIQENDLWEQEYFSKKQQKGEHLGERMQNAFQELFDLGHEKVVIIGSDLYDLDAKYIEEAYQKLDTHDAVVGPALDGGYYLFGMKKVLPNVFNQKDWGTETVFEDTLKDLENYNIHLTKALNDIDTFEDIKPYKALEYLYQ